MSSSSYGREVYRWLLRVLRAARGSPARFSYVRLSGAQEQQRWRRRRRVRIARFGGQSDGESGGRVVALRVQRRIRLKWVVAAPAALLCKLRDAYVGLVLAASSKLGPSCQFGGIAPFGPSYHPSAANPFGPRLPKEYDPQVLAQIYRSMAQQHVAISMPAAPTSRP